MIKKLCAVILIGFIWYLMYITLQTPAIPNPIDTVLFTLTNFSVFLPHLMMSFTRILIAVFLASIVGTIIGILMARSNRLDAFLSPIVYILYPIPKIAFLPILMLLFGLGETPKIILVISVIVFQFVLAAKDAVNDIDQEYFDSVKALDIKGLNMVRHLIIPAILPNFFTALRSSIGISIAVLFFGENFSTKLGIGYYIMNAYAMVNYQGMYAGIIALSFLGLILFAFLDALETRICPWKNTESL